MIIKTKAQLDGMIESGKRLAEVLTQLEQRVEKGIHTAELNRIGDELIRKRGAIPAFLNYTPRGATRPYPASICISINDEIVHGIPNEPGRELEDGDIVSLDTGVNYNGFITDSALTVVVGGESKVDEIVRTLIQATQQALYEGIRFARVGGKTGDIGSAIQAVAQRYGFGIYRELAGHGVGERVHESPDVPNYGKKGRGDKLVEGLVIAIEPMFGLGKEGIRTLKDGYTYATKDGSLSAHFEHTVVITKDGPRIITDRLSG